MTDLAIRTEATTATGSARTIDASPATPCSVPPATSMWPPAINADSTESSGPRPWSGSSSWAAPLSQLHPMSLQTICNPINVEQDAEHKADGKTSPCSATPVLCTPNSSPCLEATLPKPTQLAQDGRFSVGGAVKKRITAEANERSKQRRKSRKIDCAANPGISWAEPDSRSVEPVRSLQGDLKLRTIDSQQNPASWSRTSMWVNARSVESFDATDWNEVRRRVQVTALPPPPRELPLLPEHFLLA